MLPGLISVLRLGSGHHSKMSFCLQSLLRPVPHEVPFICSQPPFTPKETPCYTNLESASISKSSERLGPIWWATFPSLPQGSHKIYVLMNQYAIGSRLKLQWSASLPSRLLLPSLVSWRRVYSMSVSTLQASTLGALQMWISRSVICINLILYLGFLWYIPGLTTFDISWWSRRGRSDVALRQRWQYEYLPLACRMAISHQQCFRRVIGLHLVRKL